MPTNPALSTDADELREAHEAVAAFVAELQAGVDSGDAEIYNAHFADDVLWGTPFGETVVGYEPLHAVHSRLLPARVVGPSRYEAVNVAAPAPGVAVAHVSRVSLDEDGQPIPIDDAAVFSEMVLYVLVRRDGQWWLAAGQNTIMRPKPAR
jgi:uncharacterized protein (TIGR02246 family)